MFNGNFTLNWHKWKFGIVGCVRGGRWGDASIHRIQFRVCIGSSSMMRCSSVLKMQMKGLGGRNTQPKQWLGSYVWTYFQTNFPLLPPNCMYQSSKNKCQYLEINLQISRKIACQGTTLPIPSLQEVTLPWPVSIKIWAMHFHGQRTNS